jgi:hypothetical protein
LFYLRFLIHLQSVKCKLQLALRNRTFLSLDYWILIQESKRNGKRKITPISLEIDVVKFPKGFEKEEGLNWQHWGMP